MKQFPFWFSIILFSTPVNAEVVRKVSVQHVNGVYHVATAFKVRGTLEKIKASLTDYKHLTRLDPSILQVTIVATPDIAITRVKTVIQECILVFCKTITRTEDVWEDGLGNLHAKIVSELSDMKSGYSRWRFKKEGDKVEIYYTSSTEPDFWVPPWIDSEMFKESLNQHVQQAAKNLEDLIAEK